MHKKQFSMRRMEREYVISWNYLRGQRQTKCIPNIRNTEEEYEKNNTFIHGSDTRCRMVVRKCNCFCK